MTSKKKPPKRKFKPAVKKAKALATVAKAGDIETPDDFEEVESQIRKALKTELLKKYPPPKTTSRTFVAYWSEAVADLSKRDNFKRGHLSQLEVLCDLYVEYETLMRYVLKHGYTYYATTRGGDQWKQRPEVLQLNRTRSEIRSYSRTLGLLLVRDKDVTDGETEEWG